jgi:hypothetical protein
MPVFYLMNSTLFCKRGYYTHQKISIRLQQCSNYTVIYWVVSNLHRGINSTFIACHDICIISGIISHSNDVSWHYRIYFTTGKGMDSKGFTLRILIVIVTDAESITISIPIDKIILELNYIIDSIYTLWKYIKTKLQMFGVLRCKGFSL